jgi:hypothetical protein
MANPMPEGFVMIAGEQARTDENQSRNATSRTLTGWQETNGRFWSSVEVMESIYGWYVRATSGLDGFAIMAATKQRGGPLDGTFEAAAQWAINWCEQDSKRRYAYVRRSALARASAS